MRQGATGIGAGPGGFEVFPAAVRLENILGVVAVAADDGRTGTIVECRVSKYYWYISV